MKTWAAMTRPERLEALARRLAEGRTLSAIGREFRVSSRAVQGVLQRNREKVERRRDEIVEARRAAGQPVPEKQVADPRSRWERTERSVRDDAIRQAVLDGTPVSKIAEDWQIWAGSIRRTMRRLGLKAPRQAKAPATKFGEVRRVVAVARAVAERQRPDVERAPFAEKRVPQPPSAVPFLGRSASQCAFPLWSGRPDPRSIETAMVCGAPVVREGATWCAACSARVYAKPATKAGNAARSVARRMAA